MFRNIMIVIILSGCNGIPEDVPLAKETAYANKCLNGEGAPVDSYDFYKQSESWKNSYSYYKHIITCEVM